MLRRRGRRQHLAGRHRAWSHYPPPGAPVYDGWQLVFDPVYAGEGNTCTFTDDWMWSAKEGGIPPSANGFHFLLVSPSINVTGWTGGLVEYNSFHNGGRECVDLRRSRPPDPHARRRNAAAGYARAPVGRPRAIRREDGGRHLLRADGGGRFPRLAKDSSFALIRSHRMRGL